MHRHVQFDMRENPASNRRHGSRLAVRTVLNTPPVEEETATPSTLELPQNYAPSNAHSALNVAPPPGATGANGRTAKDPHSPVPASHPTIMREFEPLISSSEAARLLGNIHVKTLQRYARRGGLPGYQIGGHWFFRASELDSWLRSRLNSNCQPVDRVDLTMERIP
jgi:excisionase family DNA binding protein